MSYPPRTEYATLDRLFAGNDLSRVIAEGWFFYRVNTRTIPLTPDAWREHVGRTRVRIPRFEDTGNTTPERPVVAIISPTPNGPLGPTEPVIFEVTCGEAIVSQRFNVRTGGASSPWEVQYRDGETSPGAEVIRTEVTNGFRFTVRRAAGTRWAGRQLELEPTFGTATAVAATNT